MAAIHDFIVNNAFLLVFSLAALVILLIALGIALQVKRANKWREREFETNRDTEMLKVRIGELEKETAQLHEREAKMLSERDAILMAAHEKADDILEQTMERVQKSEAQIRQNRIIASCCITDARRRISDLMIEVSKRLVIEDGNMLDAEQVTPEAVEAAEKEEQLAAQDFAQTIAASDKPRPDAQSEQPAQAPEPEKEAVSPEAPEEEPDSAETPEPDAQPVGQPDESHDESAGETQPSAEEAE